jgi:threonylcarbamoyladenosine tRNA methylthiotransferase CDKAL1
MVVIIQQNLIDDTMKVYIETFGCTFNQADSQIMAGLLHENHAKIVSSLEEADLVILNTCYVKHPTEQKVITRIQRIQKDFPDKKLIIGGCMVEIDPDKLARIAPDAGWIGPHQLQKTPDVVKSSLNGKNIREVGFSRDNKVGLPKMRFNKLIHIIQICEGCLGQCTYCCTRFARGSLQSYPIEMIKDEARQAVKEGCVEIQLTAQDTAAFGKDTGEKLSDLIKEIASLEGKFRIRVGMMHPNNMMGDVPGLVEAFKSEKVYKFLHIPIQSGNDDVLEHMRRGHTVEDFKEIVRIFKYEIPEISIATDIIVAYPTEDENAFQDTCNLLKEITPDFIHLSKYKPRHRAESSSLGELDHKIVKTRSKTIDQIKSEITELDNLKLIGTHQEVLIVEKGSKGGLIARTNSYKPVIVPDGEIGTFVEVEIMDATSTYLKAFK